MTGTHGFGVKRHHQDDSGPAKKKQVTARKPSTDKEEQGMLFTWLSFIKTVNNQCDKNLLILCMWGPYQITELPENNSR